MTTRAPAGGSVAGLSAAAARRGTYLSAAALFSDGLGQVLLARPTYRADEHWILIGGQVEPGESPYRGCRREVREELGIDPAIGRVLAASWLGPEHAEAPREEGWPGDLMTVFDGGLLSEDQAAGLVLQESEIAEVGWFGSVRAAALMSPLEGQIMLAALRARLGGTGAYLENGRYVGSRPALDELGVHVRPRAGRNCPWHPGTPVPERLPVRQAWGWLFVPDGRVLVVIDPAKPLAALPGGTVEDDDPGPEATLRREVMEEAQARIGDPVRLGWVFDETGAVYGHCGPCARLRLAAPVTALGPAATDPATGRVFGRLLTSPVQAAELLGLGEGGRQQAAQAAESAARHWNIPPAAEGPVTAVPEAGMQY